VSNLLLPNLRQPRNLSWGWPVKKTPSYSTIVQTPASRRGEVRISLTPNPVWNFEIDLTYIYGDLQTANSAIKSLLGFYNTVKGASDDWLFLDPYDNLLTGELLGYGDGVTTQFQFCRTLGFGGFEMMQTVFPTALYINSVAVPAGPQPSGNQWYCGLENLLNYSQDFSQSAYWVNSLSVVVTPNNQTAPDGTMTADTLAFPATAFANLKQNASIYSSPGLTVTFSVWLKAAAPVNGPIYMALGHGPGPLQESNLIPSITTAWQRFSLTKTFPFGPGGQGIPSPIYGAIVLNSGQPATTIYAWGAQLERWSSATSYVVSTNNAPVQPLGLASFNIAPASSLSISADFNYYYRCRFLEDEWTDLSEFLFQLWELKALKFRSLII